LAARISVTTVPSWDEIAKWENSLIVDQLETDEGIRRKVRELTAGKTDLDEKMRAVYGYVAKKVRYVERRGEPIFGIKPHAAVNVFSDGFGVCKDKAILLIAMLKEIGVEAGYVLLRPMELGLVSESLPTPWFIHAVVYVFPRVGEEGFFLDPTAGETGFRDIHPQLQGATALLCGSGPHRFLKIPESPAERNVMRSTCSLTLRGDGSASAVMAMDQTGFFAAYFRGTFRNSGTGKHEFESMLGQSFPGLEVKDYRLTGLDDLDSPIQFKVSLSAPSVGVLSGNELRFKVLHPLRMTDSFAKQSQRRYDLLLPFPRYRYSDSEEFSIPEGYAVSGLPGLVNIETPLGSYHVLYSESPGKMTIERKLEMKVMRVQPKDYKEFRDFCVKVDAEDRKEVVLTRK
jgi:hypothetical protein